MIKEWLESYKPKNIYVRLVIFVIMTTLTIELINEKALHLLKDLEDLKIIRVVKKESHQLSGLRNKLKEPMSVTAIETQLNEIRNQWQRNIY